MSLNNEKYRILLNSGIPSKYEAGCLVKESI
jgi:hypothetical protein